MQFSLYIEQITGKIVSRTRETGDFSAQTSGGMPKNRVSIARKTENYAEEKAGSLSFLLDKRRMRSGESGDPESSEILGHQMLPQKQVSQTMK